MWQLLRAALIQCTYSVNNPLIVPPARLHDQNAYELYINKTFLFFVCSRIYGFYDECKRRYNIKLWKTFTDCFNCLPIGKLMWYWYF